MSNNVIRDRIQDEANALINNLYGADVATIRRQIIAFNVKAMNVITGADSFIDPILLKVVRSKYSTAIVIVAIITLLGLYELVR